MASKKMGEEQKLATMMEAMTFDQEDIQTAVQLLSKAIKREKTAGLLLVRARLYIKLKR